MLYTVTSDQPNLFYYGLFNDDTGDVDVDVLSETSTALVLENQFTGAIVTLAGTGLQLTDGGSPVAGTITSITVTEGDLTPLGTITGIAWSLLDFEDALAGLENDNGAPMAALIDSAAPITIDLTAATGPVDLIDAFSGTAELVTVGATVLDSAFDANLMGTAGNDTFVLTGPTDDYNYVFIEASEGNDTIDGTAANSGLYVDLGYAQYDLQTVNPISVDIDTTANTGTISFATFTDTILDVRRLMTQTDGFGIEGSALDDSFEMAIGAGTFTYITGQEGADSYDLTIGDGASIRLSFNRGADSGPTQGVVVDLGAGTVTNDGFGNAETVDFTIGNGARIEIRGSDNDDVLTGQDGRDSFITEQGNDTVDGGDGWDRIRYDRNGVEQVNVNLETGVATGIWDGQAFTDSLSDIEDVRGSRSGDDMLIGSDADEAFDGRGGNDTISAGLGDDEAFGDSGDDQISMGGGNDLADGEDGDDLLRGNAGEDTLFGGQGNDQLRGQSNGDYLDGGDGNDNIKGGGGNDTLIGGEGRDFLNGGTRRDSIEGGDGNDNLIGRSFNDVLRGGAGNDRLNGGGENDVLEGGEGDDFLKGGDGADRFLFYFDFGTDRVNDADFSVDTIEIAQNIIQGRSEAEIEALAFADGNDMVLDLSAKDGTHIIRFQGMSDVDGLAEALVFI